MIPVNQAVKASKEFLKGLGRTAYGVRVEEIEESSDGDWLITIGFYEDAFMSKMILKIFTVDGNTGEVRAMKIHPSP